MSDSSGLHGLYSPWGSQRVGLNEFIYVDGEGNGTPLQYSCLENAMDGGAWKSAVHGVAEGRAQLSDFTFTFHFHALEKEMATHSSVFAFGVTAHPSTDSVKVLVTQSCPTLCDPHGLYSPWNSLGQNTGVGSLSLLQGIIPAQGSNPGLPHCRRIHYQLSHKESPRILE